MKAAVGTILELADTGACSEGSLRIWRTRNNFWTLAAVKGGKARAEDGSATEDDSIEKRTPERRA